MNQQIKSHWRLTYRIFIQALKVTFSVPYRNYKANLYSMVIYGKLERQRELFSMLPNDELITLNKSMPKASPREKLRANG